MIMSRETRTGVSKTQTPRTTVNVGQAVAIMDRGPSDATFSTVTAAKILIEQCAVAKVTKVIAVCCP